MTEYPRITELLDNCARWPDWRKYNKDLETELRALLAERDALKADVEHYRQKADGYQELAEGYKSVRDEYKADLAEAERERDALKAKAPMERKLREYKGVTYRGGSWHYRDTSAFMASALISGYCDTFTDADHAAIYALRDDPYEPVEPVEDIVRGIINGESMCRASLAQVSARLRAAVAAEMAQGEGR